MGCATALMPRANDPASSCHSGGEHAPRAACGHASLPSRSHRSGSAASPTSSWPFLADHWRAHAARADVDDQELSTAGIGARFPVLTARKHSRERYRNRPPGRATNPPKPNPERRRAVRHRHPVLGRPDRPGRFPTQQPRFINTVGGHGRMARMLATVEFRHKPWVAGRKLAEPEAVCTAAGP